MHPVKNACCFLMFDFKPFWDKVIKEAYPYGKQYGYSCGYYEHSGILNVCGIRKFYKKDKSLFFYLFNF